MIDRTIAIVATADTKIREIDYLKEFITSKGFKVLTIDCSSRFVTDDVTDISAVSVAEAAGFTIDDVLNVGSRAKAVAMMQLGIKNLISTLFSRGKIHAVLGFGGLQNSILSSSAMQQLPIGIPKVLLSTIACGPRTFNTLVGNKDVMVLPSIGDLVGVNTLTRIGLENSAAAIMGMVTFAGNEIKPEGFIIGATIMGATSDGILEAIQQVEAEGYEVITFHSTGVGGSALEEQINAGVINAVLDLSLHEIVSQDIFRGGFSNGAKNRLSAAVKLNIPLVLSPGGLDFVDFSLNEFKAGIIGNPDRRKYTLHNEEIAHIKLFPEEAAKAAQVIVERLSSYSGSAVMILPLRGLRADTQPEQKLHDPEVDQAIFDVLRRKLNRNIKIIELDAHISKPVFSQTAAEEMIRLIKN